MERKQTAAGHTVTKSKQPDGGAQNQKARKFKMIFLDIAIKHKITKAMIFCNVARQITLRY